MHHLEATRAEETTVESRNQVGTDLQIKMGSIAEELRLEGISTGFSN